MASVATLPPELLMAIFTLLRPIRPFDSKRTPLQVLSSVSPRWRAIAQATPELWADIRLYHVDKKAVQMLTECIERSNGLPLDISLRGEGIDTSPQSMSVFLTIVGRVWSPAIVPRWRALSLGVTKTQLSAIRAFGRKSASGLEFLHLYLVQDASQADVPSHALFPGRVAVLDFGLLPNLKELVLEGIGLDVSEASFAERLVTLSLSGAGTTKICTQMTRYMHQFSAAAAPVPALRNLRLRGTTAGPIPASEFASMFLPHVTSLDLSQIVPTDATALISMFYTLRATLKSLTLGEPTIFPLIDALRRTHPKLRFLNVHTLCLHRLDWNSSDTGRKLFLLFPAVERLILRDLLFSDASIALAPLVHSDEKDKGKKVVMEQLRVLRLEGSAYGLQELQQFVEQRRHLLSNDSPGPAHLTTPHRYELEIAVDEPPVVNLEALRWLRENVRGFRMVKV
ncbi:F-box domain-containing protein [Mycena kentingensis (nom. inval.)]|nr:F-box domain-containing protein [Mycena kentingensis (nom. inval.)]